MSEDPASAALIRHHIATATAADVDGAERVASSRWLIQALRQQLRRGAVNPDLAAHFYVLLGLILAPNRPDAEARRAAKDAGRLLGLVRDRGKPAETATDKRNLSIAVAVEKRRRIGMTLEAACADVAQRVPTGKIARGRLAGRQRHMHDQKVKEIYEANKIAARAAIQLAWRWEHRAELAEADEAEERENERASDDGMPEARGDDLDEPWPAAAPLPELVEAEQDATAPRAARRRVASKGRYH